MPHRSADVTPLPHEAAELLRLMAKEIEETAVFLMDTNGVITGWNKAAEIWKGYRPADAFGQFFGMLYTYEDQARGWPMHNIGEAIKHGYFREESWRKRKDDTLFWAQIALTALRDEDDRLLGFSKITLDLTAHKKLDQCLNEKEKTRRILAAANAGTWKLDTDTGALEVSCHLNQILGHAEGDIGNTLDDWLTLLHPDKLAEVAALPDINGLKQMQKSLELEKERAQVTLAALTDGVVTTDLNGRAERTNPAAERLTGWNQSELQGRPITDMFRIVEERTEAPIANPVSRCLQEDRVQESASHAVLIGRAGQRFSIEYAVAPIHLAGNRLDGAVLVLHDVTESRGLLHDLS